MQLGHRCRAFAASVCGLTFISLIGGFVGARAYLTGPAPHDDEGISVTEVVSHKAASEVVEGRTDPLKGDIEALVLQVATAEISVSELLSQVVAEEVNRDVAIQALGELIEQGRLSVKEVDAIEDMRLRRSVIFAGCYHIAAKQGADQAWEWLQKSNEDAQYKDLMFNHSLLNRVAGDKVFPARDRWKEVIGEMDNEALRRKGYEELLRWVDTPQVSNPLLAVEEAATAGVEKGDVVEALLKVGASAEETLATYLKVNEALGEEWKHKDIISAALGRAPKKVWEYLETESFAELDEDAKDRLWGEALVQDANRALAMIANDPEASKSGVAEDVIEKALRRSPQLAQAALTSEELRNAMSEDSLATAASRVAEAFGMDALESLASASENEVIQQTYDTIYWRLRIPPAPSSVQAGLQSLSGAPEAIQREAIEKWASSDPTLVLDWAVNRGNDPFLTPEMAALVVEQAGQAPFDNVKEDVIRLVESPELRNDPTFQQAFDNFMRDFARTSGQEAFEWAKKIENPVVREDVLGEVVKARAFDSPFDAPPWIQELPYGEDRDRAIGYLVVAIPDDPEGALHWAASIGGNEMRMEYVADIIGKWATWNPNAAMATLDSLSIPEEERQTLRQRYFSE